MEIKIKNLAKSYVGKEVLHIESLQLPSNSLCGIIGTNGAGKSTFIRIIAGLESYDSGQIQYNGSPLTPTLYKEMTIVNQKPYLFRTSVFNNIAYPLLLRRERKQDIKVKVKNMLKKMDIEKLQNQNAWTLSGGEAQKVALARALVFKPSLLLLDEPTANIDPSSIMTIEKAIKNFHKEGDKTVLIVTHNIQQAKRLCDFIIFINKGKIEDFGSTEEVIFHSKNPITRKFVEGEIIV